MNCNLLGRLELRPAETKALNPYWAAYARATHCEPEGVTARDGNCAEFMVWMSQRWQEWRRANGKPSIGSVRGSLSDEDHARFGDWLEVRASELAEELRRG